MEALVLGPYFLINGQLESVERAVVALDDEVLTHGLGCYETLKLRSGTLYFPAFHEERLFTSAAVLGMRHSLRAGFLAPALARLAEANKSADCNLKIILAARAGRDADWYAYCVAPPAMPESAPKDGVDCLIYPGQRQYPKAKSLSVLMQSLAHAEAAAAGAWDAILENGRGELTEGSRTNIFYAPADAPADYRGPLWTPPATDVLEGVTRRTLLAACADKGVATMERPLLASELRSGAYTLFLTGTSIRVLPVRAVLERDGRRTELGVPPFALAVHDIYDAYLRRWAEGARL